MTAITIVVFGLIVSFAALASEPEKGLGPREGTLKVGDPAPDFTLKSPDGKTTFTLSAFKGKKPVVLVFGSYT
jgi:cytochrome oxidase Cu insertion factor (SCO1/SenC/PrrC family)